MPASDRLGDDDAVPPADAVESLLLVRSGMVLLFFSMDRPSIRLLRVLLELLLLLSSLPLLLVVLVLACHRALAAS